MKRKLMLLGLVISLMIAMAVPALAFSDDELYFITDQPGLLSESQWQALEDRAADIANTYLCGVYVAVVEDYSDYGYTPMAALNWIYENHGLGYGEDCDGIILLLSMAERDYSVRSFGGWGCYAFSDGGIDRLEKEFLDDFGEDAWYDGMLDYLSECQRYLEAAQQQEPIGDEVDLLFCLLMILGIPCVVALVVCLILWSQMKSVRKQTGASVYMKMDQCVLRIREDRFSHTTQTRRKIESSSSGSSTSGNSGKF